MYHNLSRKELLREQARQNMGKITISLDSHNFPLEERMLLWIGDEPHVRLFGKLYKVTKGQITCRYPLMTIWEIEVV